MSIREISCTYRDQRFFGIFDVSGNGATTAVWVRYNGDEDVMPVGSLAAETVAENLLRELVIRKFNADTVTNAERGRRRQVA
ncbi:MULTISPECIES: hypothetical protein [Lichenihabitans]|uniref:hypothetical protein n=1 Tax=Lichenihabitans TaxID=2723776 RepID=UPI00103606E2|nr:MULTISPECIES: hypothetical protein [Lichenihabitans]UDL94609.1 hypothetical protein LGH83_19275 [Lichenihabitans sp. PAMC28606]